MSKKIKHTPGPWKSSQGFIGSRHCMFVSCDPKKYDGMHIQNGEIKGEVSETSRANSLLISVAPEMLDALILSYKSNKKACLDVGGCPYQCVDSLSAEVDCENCLHSESEIQLKEAIEKATGLKIEEVLKDE